MGPGLARHGVTVVALSKDPVADAAKHKARDGLSFTVLSDEKLEVIQQFGVEHHKAIEFSKIPFTILGVPMALVPSIKKMAIPTSLLIDEQGTIRWIDQTDDYRIRGDANRVLAAVEAAFGTK
jgi:peroxiredoxin